jgi:predicted secreted protein
MSEETELADEQPTKLSEVFTKKMYDLMIEYILDSDETAVNKVFVSLETLASCAALIITTTVINQTDAQAFFNERLQKYLDRGASITKSENN